MKLNTNIFTIIKSLNLNRKSHQFIGRWTISGVSNSNDNINKIIDRNNEDHCGICKEDINLTNKEKMDNDNDNYYIPFII
jgi:hypothetical protein